jgi:hypothetical protein
VPDDPLKLIEAIGKGKSRLLDGLPRASDGLIDLRRVKVGQPRPETTMKVGSAVFGYSPLRQQFRDLIIEDVDLSGAHLENSYGLGCSFRNVRFDRAKCRGANFTTSTMESVSFVKADLRYANWGPARFDGPTILNATFRGGGPKEQHICSPDFPDVHLDAVQLEGSPIRRCTLRTLYLRWLARRSLIQRMGR